MRWLSPAGIKAFKMIMEGRSISWIRKSPPLTRMMTIYPDMLTPEQQQRLDQIEQELLGLAYTAEEESRHVLRGSG
jgi:hypothetical protein